MSSDPEETLEAEEVEKTEVVFDVAEHCREMATGPNKGDIIEGPPEGLQQTDDVPGLSIKWVHCAAYEITWEMLGSLKHAKDKYRDATLVPTSAGLHIIRGMNRTEWSNVQKEVASKMDARRAKHIEQGSNARWAESDLEMRMQEHITIHCAVFPQYNDITIRKQSAGIASILFEAIMGASDLASTGQELPPIKL